MEELEKNQKQIVENNVEEFGDFFKKIIKSGITEWIDFTKLLEEKNMNILKMLSKKNISELLSKFFENAGNKTILEINDNKIEVQSAENDRCPDLNFLLNSNFSIPFEIKVTSTTTQWTGGELSDRSSYYLMISWDYSKEKRFKIFATFLFLHKNDWESVDRESYYGTRLQKKLLADRIDRHDIMGGLKIKENLNSRYIYLIQEEI